MCISMSSEPYFGSILPFTGALAADGGADNTGKSRRSQVDNLLQGHRKAERAPDKSVFYA